MLRLAFVVPLAAAALFAGPAFVEVGTPPSVTAEPNSDGGLDITVSTNDSSDVKDLHILPPETPKGGKVDVDIDAGSLPSGWTGRPANKGVSFGAGSAGGALPANSTHTFKVRPGGGTTPRNCYWSLTRDGATKPPKDPFPEPPDGGGPIPTGTVVSWAKGDMFKPFRIRLKGVPITIPPDPQPVPEIALSSDSPVVLSAFCDGEPTALFRVFVLETTPRAQKLRHVQTDTEERTLGFDGEVCTDPPFFVAPDHGNLDATSHASISVRRYQALGDRTFDLVFVVDDDSDRRFTANDVAGVVEVHE